MRENGENGGDATGRVNTKSGESKEGDEGGGEREGVGWRGIFRSKGVPPGEKPKNGGAAGQHSRPEPRFSYRDKLLSLGESGFLELNPTSFEALNGWKEYFAKMSGKHATEVEEELEEREESEEGDATHWSTSGKYPTLKVSAEEYADWCKPYINSLLVKLLGKSFRVGFMRQRMERMWCPKNPMRVTPLNNGYFLVFFSNKEDRDYAMQEGPWMIEDHYLLVQRWRPNFNPWKADNQKRIAAWIRIPDLPAELYNVESLRRIGNLVGRTIKIDRTTAFSEKGGFARICVEIDLQPLLPAFDHFGVNHRIEYEGLHLVCFHCGRYGHHMGSCPSKVHDQKENTEGTSRAQSSPGTAGMPVPTTEDQVQKGKEGNQGGGFGPQMLVKRVFSRNIKEDLKGSWTELGSQKSINIRTNLKSNDARDMKGKEKATNGKYGEEISGQFGTDISNIKERRWVQVGSKRKASTKRVTRGKENNSGVKIQIRNKKEGENGSGPKSNILNISNPFASLSDEPAVSNKSMSINNGGGPRPGMDTMGLDINHAGKEARTTLKPKILKANEGAIEHEISLDHDMLSNEPIEVEDAIEEVRCEDMEKEKGGITSNAQSISP